MVPGGGYGSSGFDYGSRRTRETQRTPYLTQVNGHPNQEMNCVPTVLAMMVARFNPAWVRAAGGSGDRLINAISDAMLTIQGTTAVDGLRSYGVLGALGQELGLLMMKTDGIDLRALVQGLRNGQQAILVGDALALPYASLNQQLSSAYDDAGHVIAVTGYDPVRRAFTVHDPGHPMMGPVEWAPEDLVAFVAMLNRNLNGASGGSMILVDKSPWV
jgi:hypothetical protein